MSNVNSILLGNRPVYDPPATSKRANFFVMFSGASRHGHGQFLMRRSDYDAIAGSGPVQLVMKSGVTDEEQTKQTVTIGVIVAGYITASQDVRGSSYDMIWCLCYDMRCELTDPISKAYNVQVDAMPVSGSDSTRFYAATLNSGSQWTWANLLTDLGVTQSWNNLPTWKPRNCVYDAVPKGQVIADVAARCRLVIGFDHTSTNSAIGKLKGYWPGQLSDHNTSLFNEGWIQKYELLGKGPSARTERRKPASYDFAFPATVTSEADPYTQSKRAYVKTVAGGGTGPKRVVHVAEFPAVYSGSFANSSELDDVANDLFSRLEAEYDLVFDSNHYGGLWPLQCDGQIRGILWQSNGPPMGATTTIIRNDDRDFNVLDDLAQGQRDQANMLVAAYGAGRAGVGSSGTRYVKSGGGNSLSSSLVNEQFDVFQIGTDGTVTIDEVRAKP